MPPEFRSGNVSSLCPDCSAITTFEFKSPEQGEFGTIVAQGDPTAIFKLLRCAGCSRAGVAKVTVGPRENYIYGELAWFWPKGITFAKVPAGSPKGVLEEYHEARLCMTVSAWRAAAALLRSTLEKTLAANGYSKGSLYDKIEAASADGVITSARRQRAHELVRTLGNDVLHEDWRPVTEGEADSAYHYVGRVIEDFYDDRPTVVKVLTDKKRLPLPVPTS